MQTRNLLTKLHRINRPSVSTQVTAAGSTRCFSDEGEKGDRISNLLIKAIDSQPRPRPKFSPEEQAKHYEIGRNYVIGNHQVHNELNHDLACKIRLKNHAITMMPRNTDEKLGYLKKHAMTVDMDEESMVPMYRTIPLDTPPIKDFNSRDYLEEEE